MISLQDIRAKKLPRSSDAMIAQLLRADVASPNTHSMISLENGDEPCSLRIMAYYDVVRFQERTNLKCIELADLFVVMGFS
jgi:hypothetical protein